MKNNTRMAQEIVYGMHPIIELLKAKKRKIITIYTTKPEPKGFKQLEAFLPRYPVPIQRMDREALTRLAGSAEHQSIVAVVAPFVYRKQFFNKEQYPMLLMLDGIQDVRNIGAILRSAYCTGVNGVIITQFRSAPITATALKASAGLAEHLDIYLAPSAQAAVLQLKQAGYHLYITACKGANVLEVAYKKPLCVVIGSEETGVTQSIMSSGELITIPQRTDDISYNASVAAGIVLFVLSQMGNSGPR